MFFGGFSLFSLVLTAVSGFQGCLGGFWGRVLEFRCPFRVFLGVFGFYEF